VLLCSGETSESSQLSHGGFRLSFLTGRLGRSPHLIRTIISCSPAQLATGHPKTIHRAPGRTVLILTNVTKIIRPTQIVLSATTVFSFSKYPVETTAWESTLGVLIEEDQRLRPMDV